MATARQSQADQLLAAVKAVQEAWERLGDEVAYRLEHGTAWTGDLVALHEAAREADRQFRVDLGQAYRVLDRLGRKGPGL